MVQTEPETSDPILLTDALTSFDAGKAIQVQTYGVRFCLRSNRTSVLDRMIGLLAPGWTSHDVEGIDRTYTLIAQPDCQRLYADSELLAEHDDLDCLLDHFETDMQIHLGDLAPNWLFVHAGVVGWRGSVIVIPGRSFSGKSTLVAAFLRAGASYYSDEFAVFDNDGLVHPYPRLLSLRRAAGRPLRPTASSLGARMGTEPLRPQFVLLPRYRPEANWKPRTLSAGQAVIELIKHTLPARRRPDAVLTVLQKALAQSVVLHGLRGEADDLVENFLRH